MTFNTFSPILHSFLYKKQRIHEVYNVFDVQIICETQKYTSKRDVWGEKEINVL